MFHSTISQTFHSTIGQTFHSTIGQTFHSTIGQTFHSTIGQTFHYTIGQTFHSTIGQTFHSDLQHISVASGITWAVGLHYIGNYTFRTTITVDPVLAIFHQAQEAQIGQSSE